MKKLLAAALIALACTPLMAQRAFDEDSFASIRAAYAGQPLVVHLWGLTCGPCLAELPRWKALRQRYPRMNLVLIQADETPPAAAQAALRDAGLGAAESWAVHEPLDDFLRASIDARWAGEMPHTLLIGAAGDITRISGMADEARVARWLDAAHVPHTTATSGR